MTVNNDCQHKQLHVFAYTDDMTRTKINIAVIISSLILASKSINIFLMHPVVCFFSIHIKK